MCNQAQLQPQLYTKKAASKRHQHPQFYRISHAGLLSQSIRVLGLFVSKCAKTGSFWHAVAAKGIS